MRALVLGGVLVVAATLNGASMWPAAEAAQVGQSAGAGQGTQTRPTGLTSLQELYGDWRVACAPQNGRQVCALSQQQTDKDTHQLLLAIELNAPGIDNAEGTLILPFGLALDRPITLQIDETAAGPPLAFRTCLPVGCLVRLAFDPATVGLLRKATTLTVRATADGGQGAAFRISLSGFSGALDRTAVLSR